jgi:hypothetical protein
VLILGACTTLPKLKANNACKYIIMLVSSLRLCRAHEDVAAQADTWPTYPAAGTVALMGQSAANMCCLMSLLQALEGRLFYAATKEQPLPRVLALLPGTRLVTSTILEYRCRAPMCVCLVCCLACPRPRSPQCDAC